MPAAETPAAATTESQTSKRDRDEQGRFLAAADGANKRQKTDDDKSSSMKIIELPADDAKKLFEEVNEARELKKLRQQEMLKQLRLSLPAILEQVAALKSEGKEVPQETIQALELIQKADDENPDHRQAAEKWAPTIRMLGIQAAASVSMAKRLKENEEKYEKLRKEQEEHAKRTVKFEELSKELDAKAPAAAATLTSGTTVASKQQQQASFLEPPPVVNKTKDGAFVFGINNRAAWPGNNKFESLRHGSQAALFGSSMYASAARGSAEHKDLANKLRLQASSSGVGQLDFVDAGYFEKKGLTKLAGTPAPEDGAYRILSEAFFRPY